MLLQVPEFDQQVTMVLIQHLQTAQNTFLAAG